MALVDELRSLMTNGGAFIGAVVIEDDDEDAQWFLTRNRIEEYGLLPLLLSAPASTRSAPDVRSDRKLLAAATFEECPALHLAGHLATTLTWGGAYGDFAGRAADAKRTADLAVDELIGDDSERFRVDRGTDRWSRWFRGIAWDETYSILDLATHRATVIAVTDTAFP